MIHISNIMAERRETASGKGSFKLALGTLLASVGMSLSGCGESSAQASQSPEATLQLASADEAKVFASLSADVQKEIRVAFKQCMAEVEEFARDVSDNDQDIYKITLEDGQDDCDGQRNSRIRIAKAEQDIEDLTRSITSDS